MLGVFLFVVLLAVSSIQDAGCQAYFKTNEGCNASFVCYHSPGESANWTNSLGPLAQGQKLRIFTELLYSVLTMTSLTTADHGNYSCVRNQTVVSSFTLDVIAVSPCVDKSNPATCKATVDGGDNCTYNWMRENCQKACGLCPKINCTEVEQATDPPTSLLTTTETAKTETSNSLPTESPESTDPRNSSTVYNTWHHLIIQGFLIWIAVLKLL